VAGFRRKKLDKTIEHSVRAEYKSTRKDLSLGGLSVRQLLSRVWKTSNQNSIFNRAAELAYYFLFALFPALIFISAMFGMIASTQVRQGSK
jgi:membrane protein